MPSPKESAERTSEEGAALLKELQRVPLQKHSNERFVKPAFALALQLKRRVDDRPVSQQNPSQRLWPITHLDKAVIVDTGPLVAFLNRTDRFHNWTTRQWERIRPPLLTSEAVLAETCFLLRHLLGGSRAVLELVNRGVIQPIFNLEEEVQSLMNLVQRYADVPTSLADACVVRMSEQRAHRKVLTLD